MDRNSAYSDLLVRHRSRVWSLCWRYAGGDWERCRDLVQEVVADLWEHFGTLRPGAKKREERAWVTLNTRRTLNHLYRGQHPVYQPLTPEVTSSLVDSGSVESEAADLVAALPEPDATIVRLRLEGYSAAEIAEQIGMGRDAVYQRLHRVVKRLREMTRHE